MSDYEERKPQGQQRAAAAPQISYIPPLPVPDQAAIQLDLQQRTLERYQQFFATPAVAQRSSAAPVLEAAQVQRTLVLQRQQSQLALQRQIAELEHDLPRDALQAALQRQAEQAGVPALPPIFSGPTRSQPSYADHAQRYAHEAVSLQRQADQHSGFVSMSAWPTIQQRAAQDLAQRFRSDTSPTIQRYAELGQSLALVQRQPQGKHVAQVVLQRLPAGERPSVQRALDEAEQEHQQFQAQDQKALELHALQRKLTEEDALAPQAIPRGSGQPLPLAVQRQLEVGLNIPREHLQTVRVHADPAAHSFAKSVQAIAATTGTDIFFQHGKLDTESAEGQELLAHEVTHTVQQAQGKVAGKGIDPDAGLEQEARLAGKAFAQNASAKNIPSVLKAPVADKFASLNTSARIVQRLAEPGKPRGVWQDWASQVSAVLSFDLQAALVNQLKRSGYAELAESLSGSWRPDVQGVNMVKGLAHLPDLFRDERGQFTRASVTRGAGRLLADTLSVNDLSVLKSGHTLEGQQGNRFDALAGIGLTLGTLGTGKLAKEGAELGAKGALKQGASKLFGGKLTSEQALYYQRYMKWAGRYGKKVDEYDISHAGPLTKSLEGLEDEAAIRAVSRSSGSATFAGAKYTEFALTKPIKLY